MNPEKVNSYFYIKLVIRNDKYGILCLLQEKAKARMMKQKGADNDESYWYNFWGKPKEYQKSGRICLLKCYSRCLS